MKNKFTRNLSSILAFFMLLTQSAFAKNTKINSKKKNPIVQSQTERNRNKEQESNNTKTSSNTKTPLIIGSSIAAAGVVALGIFGLTKLFSKKTDDPDDKDNKPITNEPNHMIFVDLSDEEKSKFAGLSDQDLLKVNGFLKSNLGKARGQSIEELSNDIKNSCEVDEAAALLIAKDVKFNCSKSNSAESIDLLEEQKRMNKDIETKKSLSQKNDPKPNEKPIEDEEIVEEIVEEIEDPGQPSGGSQTVDIKKYVDILEKNVRKNEKDNIENYIFDQSGFPIVLSIPLKKNDKGQYRASDGNDYPIERFNGVILNKKLTYFLYKEDKQPLRKYLLPSTKEVDNTPK